MQMLYDGMFENIFTGLPIVNSLVSVESLYLYYVSADHGQAITEVLDETLYAEVSSFSNSAAGR